MQSATLSLHVGHAAGACGPARRRSPSQIPGTLSPEHAACPAPCRQLGTVGIQREPSEGDYRYLAARAGFVTAANGVRATSASLEELAAFKSWFGGCEALTLTGRKGSGKGHGVQFRSALETRCVCRVRPTILMFWTFAWARGPSRWQSAFAGKRCRRAACSALSACCVVAIRAPAQAIFRWLSFARPCLGQSGHASLGTAAWAGLIEGWKSALL